MAKHFHLTAALAASMLALAACSEGPAQTAPVERAPAAGRLIVAMQATPDLKPAPATLTTRDMAEARARIAGVLVSLSVKEGDTVRRGQVIGLVRDERLGLETRAMDAQVRAAAAEAERAASELARTRDLYENGVYAKARMEQVEAHARAANAGLAAARAQHGASTALVGQGAIIAPADGRVLVADVPVGSVVMPGQTVAKITAGPLVVCLELPEAAAGGLKLGDTVRLNPADLGGASGGAITQIYPGVTAGQVLVDVAVPDQPRARIGQRVRATVKLGERQALIVPRRYVVTRFGIDYVRIVGAGDAVSETPVQTAPGPTPDTAEVLSGLRVGDVLTPAVRR